MGAEKKMAMIPYINHKYILYKAEMRVRKFKVLFIVSNCLWILGAILRLLRFV